MSVDFETKAMKDVLNERKRQINSEGWTIEHDDEHTSHGMAIAAACYALANIRSSLRVQTVDVTDLWKWTGWGLKWFKPKDNRRNLVRAAALLIAELDRIDRAEIRKKTLEVEVVRGVSLEDDKTNESRVESVCSLGVGCGTYGNCYAEKIGRPEMCERKI